MTLRENIETLTDAALEHRERGESAMAGGDPACMAYFVAAIANILLAASLRARLETEPPEPEDAPAKPGDPA